MANLKNIGGFNFQVRFKNPWFWILLVANIGALVLNNVGMTINDITTWGALFNTFAETFKNPSLLFPVVTSIAGLLIDPTTSALTDSDKVLRYSKPNSNKTMVKTKGEDE